MTEQAHLRAGEEARARAGSVTGKWDGPWDEPALCDWARNLRDELGELPVSLGLLFVTPDFFPHATELLELLRVHARIPLLVGCSSFGTVERDREIEEGAGLVLGLYSFPGATLAATRIRPDDFQSGLEEARRLTAIAPVSAWLSFLEPFKTDADAWLESWQEGFPQIPVFGGLAAGHLGEAHAQVFLNGEVIHEGGVVLGLSGVRVLGAVAQGCTPVGESWTITQVEGNLVRRIGNRPAIAVLEETFGELDASLQQRSRGNFFAGLAVDEYKENFARGDFLVRNLIGADPKIGALAVAALPRSGQTLQFQLRDAGAADQEIRVLLEQLRSSVGESIVFGGCLCICAGRGRALFGEGDHDAKLVQEIVGPSNVVGFFGNGEFGPVGARSFVHAYTAALLLFVGPPRELEDDL